MILGAHISISGGIWRAFSRAEEIGCQSMQIFTHSPRSWAAIPITVEDVEQWRAAGSGTGIKVVLVHDSYLVNLASEPGENLEKSVIAFKDEIERCDLLGIRYLVFHPGSHRGAGSEEGISRLASALRRILDSMEVRYVRLLAENTAGQGSSLGARFEELASLLDSVARPELVGICFDTAHAFGAGYDLASDEGYEHAFRELDRTVGLDRVMAFHLNDSRSGLGSGVDRHAPIGAGTIGLPCFQRLMGEPRFSGLPGVLETPNPDRYAEEIALLRSMGI